MASPRPTDLIKTLLNTLVLVTGAIGSAINLFKGNGVPVSMAIIAGAIILVLIAAEFRSNHARSSVASPGEAGESTVARRMKSRQPAQGATGVDLQPRVRLGSDGRPRILLARVLGQTPS